MKVALYQYWDSFCSFKVRICMAEKQIEWQGHHIDLMRFENLTEDYLAVNPAGVVPSLIHDGQTIVESSIINEYIDDAFPVFPLRPASAAERARMRMWVKHEEEELFLAIRPASLNLMMKQALGRYSEDELDAYLKHHPHQNKVAQLKAMFKAPFDDTAVARSRKMLRRSFERMNTVLERQPWLAGDSYSLADIAAAPVIDRIQRLRMTDLWMDLDGVRGWVARLTSRAAYLAAAPLEDFRLPQVGTA